MFESFESFEEFEGSEYFLLWCLMLLINEKNQQKIILKIKKAVETNRL